MRRQILKTVSLTAKYLYDEKDYFLKICQKTKIFQQQKKHQCFSSKIFYIPRILHTKKSRYEKLFTYLTYHGFESFENFYIPYIPRFGPYLNHILYPLSSPFLQCTTCPVHQLRKFLFIIIIIIIFFIFFWQKVKVVFSQCNFFKSFP